MGGRVDIHWNDRNRYCSPIAAGGKRLTGSVNMYVYGAGKLTQHHHRLHEKHTEQESVDYDIPETLE